MRILVTGATGTVGGHVVRQLTGRGHRLVALVRDPARAGDLPDGVEVVRGDLTDAADVRRALDGVRRAFLTMADDNGSTFAKVAGNVAVEHVVLLSSFTVVVPLPSGAANLVAARHRAGEQALTDAGVPSTFLRSAGFHHNIRMWFTGAADGVVRAPYVDVGLPIVHPADVAACAVAVLTAEAPPPGAFSITGAAPMSVREQVQIVNDVLGCRFTVEEVSEAEAVKTAFPEGAPAALTASVLETMGPWAASLVPSPHVRALTGRAPRDFRTWVLDAVRTLRRRPRTSAGRRR